jgi:ankyrin repeat protein
MQAATCLVNPYPVPRQMKFSLFETRPMKQASRWLALCLLGTIATAAVAQKGADQINVNGQLVMAARTGQVPRVLALLEQGASVNSRDRNGDSPLNMAAAKGNADMVAALLKAGADVNLANVAGVTPLMGAGLAANEAMFRSLLAAGAKTEPLDRVKKNAATYAAASGCTGCIQALVAAA